MKRISTLVLSVALAATSHAYEGNPSEQVSGFFRDMIAGDSNKAIESLYSSNPMMLQQPQQLVLMKQQVSNIAPLYGKILGSENIHKEELSPSVTRIVNVAKHENHPVVWEFYFYKPKDKWVISQAVFVDQFQTLDAKK